MDVPPSLITYLPRLRDARKRLASVVTGSPRSRFEREGPLRAVSMRAPGEEAMPVRHMRPELASLRWQRCKKHSIFFATFTQFHHAISALISDARPRGGLLVE